MALAKPRFALTLCYMSQKPRLRGLGLTTASPQIRRYQRPARTTWGGGCVRETTGPEGPAETLCSPEAMRSLFVVPKKSVAESLVATSPAIPCVHAICTPRQRNFEIVSALSSPLDLSKGELMRHLSCPCGEQITGEDDDELVDKTQAHLKEAHPDHEYSRDEILFLAY